MAGVPDDAELRRRSTEHGPSALPPPAKGLRSGAPLVYLDQLVWVRLLKGGPAAAEQLERLRSAVDAGLVVTCLSAAHYAETWHRGAWVSR